MTNMSLRSFNLSGLCRTPFRRKFRAPLTARVNLIDMKNPFASVECPSDMTDLEIFAVSCYESALNAFQTDSLAIPPAQKDPKMTLRCRRRRGSMLR